MRSGQWRVRGRSPDDLSSGLPDDSQAPDGAPDFLRLVEELWSELSRVASPSRPEVEDAGVGAPRGGERLIDRFEVLRELGRGGGGIVLMAIDPALRRTVALKVPGPEALPSPDSRARFRDEARAVAALKHPNIVTVHEAGEVGVLPYIVMDYCEAGSLSGWLADRLDLGPIPPRWAGRLVAQIADGVQHAHDRNILHRDLKPSNILLEPPPPDPPGRFGTARDHRDRRDPPWFVPKVADFGLAKARRADGPEADRTVQGVPLGTLPYMAPEAARGDGAAIGPATDVYGLGVILFELLTGRRPFVGRSQAEVLDRIRHAPPPSPRALRRDLPRDLETVCLKCLEKSPSRRYQTPSELADDLRRSLDDLPIRARRAPFPARVLARVRRHPARAALIASAAVLAIAAGGVLAWLREVERRAGVEALLSRLDAVQVAGLAGVVPRLDVGDPRIGDRLRALVGAERVGTPRGLAAAVALARVDPTLGDACVGRLLDAEPSEVGPIARLLEGRIPGLVPRLESEVDRLPAEPADREAGDRRRANAACALIALGRGGRGWSLLRAAPDPQARSFIIHRLGPAGVRPETIADRLDAEAVRGPGADGSLCAALIQSLGEVPEASWSGDVWGRVRDRLLGLYESHRDPRVHSSSKWVLRRRGLSDRLRESDGRLSKRAPSPGQGWRVGPLGITFLTIPDPIGGRVIEVSDTETTVDQYLAFSDGHRYSKRVSPGPDHPINMVNVHEAMAFCNWYGEQDGRDLRPAYRRVDRSQLGPVDDFLDGPGYRLMTDDEAATVCLAGATTSRCCGEAEGLLASYAWSLANSPGVARPVAGLKPNGFGLFDTLGNLYEWTVEPRSAPHPENQAIHGGSCFNNSESLRCNESRTVDGRQHHYAYGFRLARTVRPAVRSEPH